MRSLYFKHFETNCTVKEIPIAEASLGKRTGEVCLAFGRKRFQFWDSIEDINETEAFLLMNGRKGRCVDKDGHAARGNDNLKSSGDCGNLIKFEEVAGGGNGVKPDCQCCATEKLTPEDVSLILQ